MSPPPRALRVLHLPDRLVLHDITYALHSHDDASNRNALIDAANTVHTRSINESNQPSLIDFDPPSLPPPSSSTPVTENSYLVIPFASLDTPHTLPPSFVTTSPQHAAIPTTSSQLNTTPVDAAASLIGLLPLRSCVFAVLATHVRRVAEHPSGPVLSVTKVQLIPLCPAIPPKEEKDALTAVTKLLESGNLYYASTFDLTRSISSLQSHSSTVLGPFCWNQPMSHRLPPSCRHWAPRAIYGFVNTHTLRLQSDAFPAGTAAFKLTLISRRSRRRAGTRYITRGVDAMGDVANFVETEQIVWPDLQDHELIKKAPVSSYVVIRGSIPVYWRQNNGIARPAPELDGSILASRKAFDTHFDRLLKSYGAVTAVSLVDLQGSEGVLAQAFERHFDLYLRADEEEKQLNLVAFDFHKWCGGKEYERGLGMLLERIASTVEKYQFYYSIGGERQKTVQTGVFRVNCVDCLDRTNVVQSLICRKILDKQLQAIFAKYFTSSTSYSVPRLYSESEDRFKHIWGDNADAVSKQYSGTGALKTDFTRTGKRSTTGVIGDGMKSVMRMYYKNFVDEGRQEVIDLMCGNITIQFPAALTIEEGAADVPFDTLKISTAAKKEGKDENTLWYTFQAFRVNAGGDKQQVSLELYDDEMLVTTAEGVCLSYPRKQLISWSKHDDGRGSSDKKSNCRLRLLYNPSYENPSTTSPLDLQFKTGTSGRENFLRALVSWANPKVSNLLGKRQIRVRILAALNTSDQTMQDWGLSRRTNGNESEVIALVLPEYHTISRSQGLAAVPVDVDQSDYVLVGATTLSERGPALAVLVTKDLEQTVMMVDDATTGRSSSYAAGGAVALALEVCGTTLCFVSARLNGPTDVYNVLSNLNLGRSSFDVTNQFHHFAIAGLLGNMQWKPSASATTNSDGRKWKKLGDGSFCYTLENGLSVMRSSFSSLRYNDALTSESMWKRDEAASKGRKPSQFICLADGLIEGRPGPELPSSLSQSVVGLMDLRGEDIKMPPGIEQTSHMTPMLFLYCESSSVDGIMSRPTPRASTFPEWRETLRLPMMPGDASRLHENFIIGQVLVPSSLTDPIPAGHFVIPLSLTREGSSVFKVPCRLGGVHTGSIYGRMQVISMEDEKVDPSSRFSRPTAADQFPSTRDVMKLPQPSLVSGGGPTPGSKGYDLRSKKSQNPSLPKALSSMRQKANMDDVNSTLEAARKKGSKQIKSMVNKFSSFMNQPTSGSTVPSHMTRDISEQSFEQFPTRPFSDNSGRNGSDLSFHASSSIETRPSTAIGFSGSSTERIKSSPLPVSTNGRAQRNQSNLGQQTQDIDKFFGFQAVPSPVNNTLSREQESNVRNEDPLLRNLQGLSAGAAKKSTDTHASQLGKAQTVDQLLSGLSEEKKKTPKKPSSPLTEDDWGDFEAAEPLPSQTAYPTNRQAK